MTSFYSTSPETAQEIDNFVEISTFSSSVSVPVTPFEQSIFAPLSNVQSSGVGVTTGLGLITKSAAKGTKPISTSPQISLRSFDKVHKKHQHSVHCGCGCDHYSDSVPVGVQEETEIEKVKRLAGQFDHQLSDQYLDEFEDQTYKGTKRSARLLDESPPIEGVKKSTKKRTQPKKELEKRVKRRIKPESPYQDIFEAGIRCLSEVTDLHKQRLCSKIRQDDYNSLNEAQWLLQDELTPKGTKWRVVTCGRYVIGEEVHIVKNKQGKARYRNVARCGSGWTCPVCAKKIAEARRAEIEQGLNAHYKEYGAGSSAMITLTFPHSVNHNLSFIVHQFVAAMKWMREQRAYKELCAEFAYRGFIRVVEVTHGNSNGWHPHGHEVWLFKKEVTVAELQDLKRKLYPIWKKACLLKDLGEPIFERGIDISQAYSPAEYLVKFDRVSKWGTASELAKSTIKTSFDERSTPSDLLRKSAKGNEEAGRLFVEYAKAFFGKAQIMWSRGLKGQLGIGQMTDKQIVDNTEDDGAEIVYKIPKRQWYEILRGQNRRACDVRALLLDIAEVAGAKGVDLYIRNLGTSLRH